MAYTSQLQRLSCKIITAENVHVKAINLQKKGIIGMSKLITKIRAELKFLKKVKQGVVEFKEEYLSGSNLTNFEALIAVIEQAPSVNAVLETFHFNSQLHKKQSLTVDIVCNGGSLWVKVIARKPQALLAAWEGRGCYLEKSILSQAELYVAAAETNAINYHRPEICFVFCKGVPKKIAKDLEFHEISIKGDVPNEIDTNLCDFLIDFGSLNFSSKLKADDEISSVNLDVTAMLCLISNLCHGFANFDFAIPVLAKQAEDERMSPALPKLQNFLEGKTLYCCRSAADSFSKIVETIGGMQEKERAKNLIKHVMIVIDQPSQRTQLLCTSGKINERSKVIFGTGDSLKAITVTANSGFVRAAAEAGERFDVFFHEARALTEAKESCAKTLHTDGC